MIFYLLHYYEQKCENLCSWTPRLVGSAIWKNLKNKGYTNLIGCTHTELDLRNTQEVNAFFEKEKPEYVFLAAAKVGGILANNTYRADFIYENLMIQNNVIHAAYENGGKENFFS